MKKNLLKFLVFVFLFISVSLTAGNSENNKFYLFNQNTEKFYSYYLLESGESYYKNIADSDSIVVYTRILNPAPEMDSYSYNIKTSKYQDDVTKKIRMSKSTSAVSGEKVSSWNSYKYYTLPSDKDFLVKNTANARLLVKISKPGSKTKSKSPEFIAYPPDDYSEIVRVNINDKDYKYYDADADGIEVQIEGPALLKVISRLIVDKVDNLSYSWEATMDGAIVTAANAVSPYSGSALSDNSSKVTKGVVHLIEIPSGIHQLSIKDVEPDAILYRLYLKKPYTGK